ncbi:hypothetical protein Thiowin_00158 [Thiorhodovibrio winogradskyi]|uniref:Uncharacterized protein n=1 Tax=Thiorhodovibrio winogradskyi TaxID=77007 RepID=A0ABZ0S3G9_9GAMM|nr:hypothetical protein [Thiorhodovibrio winogradskyi]
MNLSLTSNTLDLAEQHARQGHTKAALDQLRQAPALDRNELAQRLIRGRLDNLDAQRLS